MSELNRSELMLVLRKMNEVNCRIRLEDAEKEAEVRHLKLWEDAEKEAEARHLVWEDAVAALELATEKEGRASFAAWASKEDASWRKSEWEKAKNAQ